MPNKAFLEITNVCNLACSFCHGTRREPKFMSVEEFTHAVSEIKGNAEYLYFHLMGEPLLHPELEIFLNIAHEYGFKVIITTNGTLLREKAEILLSSPALHKVSISLHSFEANAVCESLESYLEGCFDFCKKASDKGIISVMRLWNIGGLEELNGRIISAMHEFFDTDTNEPWKELYSGFRIKSRVFLEWGNLFEWPDIDGKEYGCNHSCYGLRDQFGVLSDGTVVPCCLDADGAVNLGNIFKESLTDILNSPRALALAESFRQRKVTEELCIKCGYASKR